MTKVKSLVSFRRVIGAGLMIILMVLAIWHFTPSSTSAQGGFTTAIFTVSPKGNGTFVPTSTVVGSTFSVAGVITYENERGTSLPGDDGSTGEFYRSGVIVEGGFALVNDVYILRGFNGYITATGILKGAVVGDLENADLLAVTGGVGTFRSVTGEAQLTTTNATSGKFTVWLEETARRTRQLNPLD